MKFGSSKHQLNIFLLLMIAGFFVACKRELIPNRQVADTTTHSKPDTSGNGGGVVVDTLPSFYSPAGVAVDAGGNIYVADYGNNLIRKITAAGVVSTLAGNGSQGYINAPGTLAAFNQPTGIAVDAAGNVYVGDAGNDRIRKITPAGTVSSLAGSDSTGFADGPDTTASFFHPEGISLDAAGNVYVADAGNNLIRKVTPNGTVSTLAGNGTDVSQGGIFNNPTGVAADASGNVYVANYINNNILIVTPSGLINTFAGSGNAGSANGTGSSATFYFPNSLAVDASGNVYVADGINNLVRKITPAGVVTTFAGNGTAGAVDGAAAKASFNGPAGLAVDAAGNVYVADSNNNMIRKITQAGIVTTIAGSGSSGAINGQAAVRRNPKIIRTALKKQLPVFYKVK
ncbi:NHL repeat-containing protein [Mucilaginibacter xinganensis]|nr:NHL repeat-containing protein [Mucilaginibacter xinganensis]